MELNKLVFEGWSGDYLTWTIPSRTRSKLSHTVMYDPRRSFRAMRLGNVRVVKDEPGRYVRPVLRAKRSDLPPPRRVVSVRVARAGTNVAATALNMGRG